MVRFFFYNKLTNIDILKKINNNFEIYNGYIIIKNYDIENNFLEISDNSIDNNKLLYGKIVNFDDFMTFNDIIVKLNIIEDCKLTNKIKYKLETILTTNIFGGTYKAYVIY